MNFSKQLDRMARHPDFRRHKRVANTLRKELQQSRRTAARRGRLKPEWKHPDPLHRKCLRQALKSCRVYRALGF